MNTIAGNSFGAGRARYVLTDRHGVRATPSRPSAQDPDAPALGASAGAYAALDLARHVGDADDAVEANRAAVAAALGLTPPDLRFMEQVHGADVAIVGRDADEGPPVVADALVTAEPGLALAVMVADCVPVVLADGRAGVVAVVHAGRKGIAADVIGATVAAMTGLGAEPAAIEAVVGPAVCPLCYEVPQQLQDEVAALVPEAAATSRDGTPALHLRRAAVAQLGAAGLARIDAVGGCTAEDPSLYSYRREAVTGRFAMFAWLPRGSA